MLNLCYEGNSLRAAETLHSQLAKADSTNGLLFRLDEVKRTVINIFLRNNPY